MASSSLLRLQENHVSSLIDQADSRRILRSRRMSFDEPHPYIINHLRTAGFYHVAQIRRFFIMPGLISALVERWRPETHTFHFSCGECTVTLEDVALQLGLPVDGHIVTGPSYLDWHEECQNLLGRVPPEEHMKGSMVKLSWLKSNFQDLRENASKDEILYATRAYILRLIGGLLMPDKSSGRVHLMYLPLLRDIEHVATYSWGSACLAVLYRELCRATVPTAHDIGGCLVLLQSWAWYRCPFLAPRITAAFEYPLAIRWSQPKEHGSIPSDINSIRLHLDYMGYEQFIWMPYLLSEIMACIPPSAYEQCRVWMANTALICFAVVEWHHTDRVMRQFGMQQPIPQTPMNLDEVHRIDMRGNHDEYWPFKHKQWIDYWNTRIERISFGHAIFGHNFKPSDDYIQWFANEGRPFICPPSMFYDIRKKLFPKKTSNIALHKIEMSQRRRRRRSK